MNFKKISLITFFIVNFYEIFIKFGKISTQLNPFADNICDVVQNANCLRPNI